MWNKLIVLVLILAIGSCDISDCHRGCFAYECYIDSSPFSNCVKFNSKCEYDNDLCTQEECYDECKKGETRIGICQSCFEKCTDKYGTCEDNKKTKIIVGVVVGVGVFILIIVGICCYQKRKRLREKIQNQSSQAQQQQNLQNIQMQQDMQQQALYQNQMIYNSNQIPPPYYGQYQPQANFQQGQQQMYSQQPVINSAFIYNNQQMNLQPQAKQLPINQAVI